MNIYKVLIKITKSQKTLVVVAPTETQAKAMALVEFAKYGETQPITQVIVSLLA